MPSLSLPSYGSIFSAKPLIVLLMGRWRSVFSQVVTPVSLSAKAIFASVYPLETKGTVLGRCGILVD